MTALLIDRSIGPILGSLMMPSRAGTLAPLEGLATAAGTKEQAHEGQKDDDQPTSPMSHGPDERASCGVGGRVRVQ